MGKEVGFMVIRRVGVGEGILDQSGQKVKLPIIRQTSTRDVICMINIITASCYIQRVNLEFSLQGKLFFFLSFCLYMK